MHTSKFAAPLVLQDVSGGLQWVDAPCSSWCAWSCSPPLRHPVPICLSRPRSSHANVHSAQRSAHVALSVSLRFVVTAGDMFERFTNGYIRALPHRVLRTAHMRNSIIRFNALHPATVVEPLPQFVSPRFCPRHSRRRLGFPCCRGFVHACICAFVRPSFVRRSLATRRLPADMQSGAFAACVRVRAGTAAVCARPRMCTRVRVRWDGDVFSADVLCSRPRRYTSVTMQRHMDTTINNLREGKPTWASGDPGFSISAVHAYD